MELGLSPDPPRDTRGRNGARVQDTFGAPPELPRDPLAGPDPRDSARGVRENGINGMRDSLGVPERSLGVPSDPLGSARDALGVLRTSSEQEGRESRGDRGAHREAMSAATPGTGDLAVALDEEERELWRQLRRKAEFEMRVAEKRGQLAELRDRRRGVSSACADSVASIENLTGQVDFARMHEREIEHDIAVLRESNRIMQSAFQARKINQEEAAMEIKSGHLPHTLTESERLVIRQQAREKANSIEMKREQEAVMEYEQIAHLRAHLERLVAEKASLQQRQQALLEKQHASEQDRNLLLSSLQEERKGINDLRNERLRLWEERHGMEREMTNIVQEAHFRVLRDRAPQRYRGGVDANIIAAEENTHIADPFAQETVAGKSILSGGVRVPATLDTPTAFATVAGDLFTWGSEARKDSSSAGPRKQWTSFAGDRGNTGVVDSGGAGFGMAGLEASSAPVGGITEWAGRLQEFRSNQ